MDKIGIYKCGQEDGETHESNWQETDFWMWMNNLYLYFENNIVRFE